MWEGGVNITCSKKESYTDKPHYTITDAFDLRCHQEYDHRRITGYRNGDNENARVKQERIHQEFEEAFL